MSGPPMTILVVDDEPHQREMLKPLLERAGYTVRTAANGTDALLLLREEECRLLLTDQRMPGMDGLALLRAVRREWPEVNVVVMTAYGSIEEAVGAIKQGAIDYLAKPFGREELLLVLNRVRERIRLEEKVKGLREAVTSRNRLSRLIGASQAMRGVYALIERVAAADVPVLITGESGTGKELVARAVHERSLRSQGPFVAVNCAAIPEGLVESELFGHEKGAFTGALRARTGKFLRAHGGTIFLDEVGAMRVDLQAKLLRILEEGQVEPVGGSRPVSLDVRLIAATCEDPVQAMREGRFREDLFYRLCVVPIEVPPLRARKEDIPLLFHHFLGEAAAKQRKAKPRVAPSVDEALGLYPWPGNVRELRNAAERMLALSREGKLELEDLPPGVRSVEAGKSCGLTLPEGGISLPELERRFMVQAMMRSRGNIGKAAALLGISYKTLQYRLRKHNLERDNFLGDGN